MSAILQTLRHERPDATEHAPYYGKYIAQVNGGDVVDTLRTQGTESHRWIATLSDAQGAHRYAPDKWSVRQVIGHLMDAERIFVYRALRFARQDATPLAGFDENAFVANAAFDDRSMASLVNEWRAVRDGTVAFFDALNEDEWTRRGSANGQEVTVRALAWIVAGHEVHHRALLRDRYGL